MSAINLTTQFICIDHFSNYNSEHCVDDIFSVLVGTYCIKSEAQHKRYYSGTNMYKAAMVYGGITISQLVEGAVCHAHLMRLRVLTRYTLVLHAGGQEYPFEAGWL